MKKATTNDKHSTGKRRGAASGLKGEPMLRDEEVQENNDEHIDQDLPGYPHLPSRNAQDRTIHNGSAGAFDATEHSHDEEDDDQDSDDLAMDR
jgi:hypothetical protein